MTSDMLLERLALTLLHFAWQGTLVVLLLLAISGLLRLRSPSQRYAANLMAFCIMAACPVVTFVSIENSTSQTLTDSKRTAVPVQVRPINSSKSILQPDRPAAPVGALPSTDMPVTASQQSSLSQEWLQAAKRSIVLVWLIGVAVLGARLTLGWACLLRLRQRVEPVTESIMRQAERISRAMGMRMPRIGASLSIHEAIATGVFRPLVLFPASWLTDLPPVMLEAILAHELAHLRRWDLWVNLFQRLTETMLFYHPAVWWLSRQIRLERESCCDELAVSLTGDRLSYARTLEQVGRLAFHSSSSDFVLAMGGTQMNLLTRVTRVLDPNAVRPPRMAWLVGVLALAMPSAVCWSVICSSSQTSAAQETVGEVRVTAVGADKVPAEQAKKTDEERILGTWHITNAKRNGKDIPAEEGSKFFRLTFSKDGKVDFGFQGSNKYLMQSNYKFVGEGQLDFIKEIQPILYIFKFEGDDRLTLCFDDGAKPKRPTEFASPLGSHQVVWILERVNPNEKMTDQDKVLREKALQKVEEAANRTRSASHLRDLGTAFHNHQDAHKKLPAHAIYSKDGKTPLLSWRVALLPYLSQDGLYEQFKLDEPWDSEHNKKLIPKMPATYAAPIEAKKAEGMTYYQVFTGPDTVFDGPKSLALGDITRGDGMSNTLLVVEAGNPVIWTQPADLELPKDKGKMPALGGLFGDYFMSVFCDAHVQSIPSGLDPELLRALITPNGKEKIDLGKIGK